MNLLTRLPPLLRLLWLTTFIGLCYLLLSGPVIAEGAQPTAAPLPEGATEQMQARRQSLADYQAANQRLRQEIKTLSEQLPRQLDTLSTTPISEQTLGQARLELNALRLRQDHSQASIANVERQRQTREQTIQKLAADEQLLANPAKETETGTDRTAELAQTRQALAHERAELELDQQQLTVWRESLELIGQWRTLAEQRLSRLEEAYQRQQAQARQQNQTARTQQLEQAMQTQLEQVAKWRAQLQQEGESLSEARRRLLETRIQRAEEQAVLLQFDMRLARAADDLAGWDALATRTDADPKLLLDALGQLDNLRNELQNIAPLGQRNLELFTQQQQMIAQRSGLSGDDEQARREELNQVNALIKELKARKEQLDNYLQAAAATHARLESHYRERLSQDLLGHTPFPTDAEAWQQLLRGVIDAQPVLLYQIRLSLETAGQALLTASISQWLLLIALQLVLARLWLAGYRWNPPSLPADDTSFLGRVLRTVHRLLRLNLWGIALAAALVLVLLVMRVPQPSLGILLALILLWIGLKLPVNLAWLLLAAPSLPDDQRHPTLYRQLAAVLISGGLLAALAILAHLTAIEKPVSSLFNRVFMAYWLVVWLVLLRLRRQLAQQLLSRFPDRSWPVSVRLVGWLLPLVLLAATLLGLVGYVNLAWLIAWYWLLFVVVLIGWLLMRGLLNDLVVVLKNYALTHSDYGLLWTQDIITPLHRLLGILLVVAAGLGLFHLYGWNRNFLLITDTLALLEKPLFEFGGAAITPWRILLTVTTLWLVIRLGQWSRGITYRWVYAHLSDLGVRHSLSVFTQYFIVLIGLLLTLRLLGFDLTTLTVFAGAVGVGIGFGLQNIANNFISGLLLLIERPLRSGDTVQIGTHTGRISRIGIRSLILKTFDNQEVIVPNSDVISTAFTNWTHSDNVIRTILMIGVSYDADLDQVQALLEQAVKAQSEILDDPEWSVYLWEFGDSAVLFRVQYYTDMVGSNTFQVRSNLLFTIWRTLHQAGISIPYPQREVHIREWPPNKAVARRETAPDGAAVAQDAPVRRDMPVGRNILTGRGPEEGGG